MKTHQELGHDLKLFFIDDTSPGSCFFLPHGTILYHRLMNYLRKYYRESGFSEVITPNLFTKDLWMTSGHWSKYQKDMFIINKPSHKEDCQEPDERFSLKPMNCPSHCIMFKKM